MHENPESALVARSHGLHVRALRAEAREADFVASTDAVDSYEEVVEQSWRLDRFKSNPVVLFGHRSRELPIGIATRCEIVNGQLECTLRFVTEDKNPLAEQVWKMVRDGELRAVSVGFVPNTVRVEKRDGRDTYVLADNELHEISVVPIPANPEALSKMKAKAIAAAVKNVTTDAALAAKEPRMSEHEKALAAEREAHATTEKQLEEARVTLAAVEKQNSALVTERDAAVARAEKAEAGLIEAEVAALVGVKITPAEKDDFVALRKSNPELFTRFVAQRSALHLTEQVVDDAAAPPAITLAAGAVEPDLTVG